jgi:hypothetical protein
MNLRSGRRRNPFGVGIDWLATWRDSLRCLMTAAVVGSSSIATAAAIERKPKVGTTRMDSRQTATGAVANIARTLQKEFLQPARCRRDLCGESQRGCWSPVKRLTICSITASALANVSSFVSGKIGCGMKTIS